MHIFISFGDIFQWLSDGDFTLTTVIALSDFLMKNKHGFSIHTHYAKLVVFITDVGDYIQCQSHFHGVNSYHNIVCYFPKSITLSVAFATMFFTWIKFQNNGANDGSVILRK